MFHWCILVGALLLTTDFTKAEFSWSNCCECFTC